MRVDGGVIVSSQRRMSNERADWKGSQSPDIIMQGIPLVSRPGTLGALALSEYVCLSVFLSLCVSLYLSLSVSLSLSI